MKVLRFISLCLLILALTACGSSYNEKGFELVKGYTDEMVTLIDKSVFEISNQATEGKLNDNLIEYAKEIRELNDKYWDSSLNPEKDGEHLGSTYDEKEISGWLIKMSGGGKEWNIEGDALAEALYNLEEDSDYLAQEIESVLDDLSEDNIERLGRAMEAVKESSDEIKKVIYND